MTNPEADRRRLARIESRPISKSTVIVMWVCVAVTAIGSLITWIFDRPSNFSGVVLLTLAAAICPVRYTMIDPLVREVQRLRDASGTAQNS